MHVGTPIVRLHQVSKSYGPTAANRNLSFELPRGGIVGLVGANGAGKSTLMRILSGIETPDSGEIAFDGIRIDATQFNPRQAARRGIRIVHQELSLCGNLSVLENFYLEDPASTASSLRWRPMLARRASQAVEAIFPGANISPTAPVADLSLAQRQMVEIAKAASDEGLKLLILDEPTSSLDSTRSEQLLRFMRKRSKDVTFIFITHKLREVLGVASTILVMRNGSLVWQGGVGQTGIDHLVDLMGGGLNRPDRGITTGSARTVADIVPTVLPPLLIIPAEDPMNGLDRPILLHPGEVIGLAGLEGGGQREFVKRIQATRRKTTAFVAGDRAREGVFPTDTVQFNAIIGDIARRGLAAYCAPRDALRRLAPWFDRLTLPLSRASSPILDLSGGNQQKALMARALVTDAPLVLLDDPTRGVDVRVKEELYAIIREMAARGTAFLWGSTEDAEFLQCDRVLVFRGGRAQAEFQGKEISEAAVVAASFERDAAGGQRTVSRERRRSVLDVLAPVTLAIVLVIMAILNPSTMSDFGLSLLLNAAVPVVLVAISQMFIVGGSEIDLSIGAFAGMTSVISATALVLAPLLGVLALLLSVVGYSVMVLVIELFAVPAIVVTLGASFVWLGIGYTIQLTPGGASPAWLTAIFTFSMRPIPTPLVLIAVAVGIAAFVNASRSGVVLRAIGNNRRAVGQLGWPVLQYQIGRYALASLFGVGAGLSLTAVNGSSDVNAGTSFTLMSVASIVIGGSLLQGGWVRPLRTACGALTLSLAGAILGLLNVSTDYSPAVQGGLLVFILLITSIFRGSKE
jgi:ribose transport system ATP-binding protein